MKMSNLSLGILCCLPFALAGCGKQDHHEDHTSSQSVTSVDHTKSIAQSLESSKVSSKVQSSGISSIMSSSKSTNNSNLSDKQLGTLLITDVWADQMKDDLAHPKGEYYIGTVPANTEGYPKNLAGYKFITTMGDPTSYVYFKQKGNQINYWMVDMSHADCVADAPLKSYQISINRLLNDYYQTLGQQNEINNFANQLKPAPTN